MNDRLLTFVVYATTPIMLVVGLGMMYLLIGDHPRFYYMVGGYVVLLIMLFLVKLSIYRFLISRREAALAAKNKTVSGSGSSAG